MLNIKKNIKVQIVNKRQWEDVYNNLIYQGYRFTNTTVKIQHYPPDYHCIIIYFDTLNIVLTNENDKDEEQISYLEFMYNYYITPGLEEAREIFKD